ncbi:MAG: radical SAM protein [Succinivibrionaceae bacterium]|nr:radical SAM protein [Succinivibrionaceae bacterium]
MLIGLHDSDNTGFPNYALMKISAYHKELGDAVEWWNPMLNYDRVYSSKVFTFTPENPYLPADTIKGGTGYGLYSDLPPEIDGMFPDYSIYPKIKYAIGFLTRGCIRNCPWCIVPKKEGKIRPYDTWERIKRRDSRDIVFMDNNVLACPHGLEQMENMVGKDVRVDFNQGLDSRLITKEIAKILAGLKWIRFIRTACDTDASMTDVANAVDRLASYGVKPYRIFCYVLVQDIPSAERRIQFLRGLGVDPFAQPYRDFTTNTEPARELKDFARWVNDKAIFRSCKSFSDYKTGIRGRSDNWRRGDESKGLLEMPALQTPDVDELL